jgi:hypothetical protein
MSYFCRPARRSTLLLGLYLKAVVGGVLLAAVFWALAHFGLLPAWVCVLLGLAAFIAALAAPEMVRASTMYCIAEGEVRCSHGILNRRQETIRVHNVLSREIEQSLLERFVLRTGTVVFSSGATNLGTDDIRFAGVAHPQRAVEALRSEQDGPGVAAVPTQSAAVSQVSGINAPPQSTTGLAQMPPMNNQPFGQP